jgi:hypothetical protein
VVLPLAAFESIEVTSDTVDPSVIAGVAQHLAEFGAVSPEPLSYGMLADGSIRIVVEITDPGGITWPMAVRLGPDKTLLVPSSP